MAEGEKKWGVFCPNCHASLPLHFYLLDNQPLAKPVLLESAVSTCRKSPVKTSKMPTQHVKTPQTTHSSPENDYSWRWHIFRRLSLMRNAVSAQNVVFFATKSEFFSIVTLFLKKSCIASPSTTYRDLYLYCAQHTLGSHVHIVNSAHLGNLYTTGPQEFFVK